MTKKRGLEDATSHYGGDGSGGDGDGSGRDGSGKGGSGGDGRGGGSSLAQDEDTSKPIFAAAAPEEDEGTEEDAAFDLSLIHI